MAAEALLKAVSLSPVEAVAADLRADFQEYGTLVVCEAAQDHPDAGRLRWLGQKLWRAVETINASDAVYQAGSALAQLLLRLHG